MDPLGKEKTIKKTGEAPGTDVFWFLIFFHVDLLRAYYSIVGVGARIPYPHLVAPLCSD